MIFLMEVQLVKQQFHTLIWLYRLTSRSVQGSSCQPAEGEHIQTKTTSCSPQLLYDPHWGFRVWKDISCLVWTGQLDAHNQRVMLYSLSHVQNLGVVITFLNLASSDRNYLTRTLIYCLYIGIMILKKHTYDRIYLNISETRLFQSVKALFILSI